MIEPHDRPTTSGEPGAPDAPDDLRMLDGYIAEHAGKYADEALVAALVRAGHSENDARTALAAARERDTGGVTGGRVAGIIIAAYVGTFLVLAVGMLSNMTDTTWIAILLISLGIALAVSLRSVGSRSRRLRSGSTRATSFAVFFGLPVLLLIVVAGLCVASGLPIPRDS